MDTLQILGAEFLVNLQKALLGPLETPMRALTFLGEEAFYMIGLTFVFWCVHRELGFRLLFVLVLTNFINVMGKWIVHRPRPYWFDPNVKGMVGETSYGPPSGHSQNPMSVWSYAAAWMSARGQKWFWALALGIVFLIGFSRMVLGVHFPHALILGWTIGALVAFLCWRYTGAASDFFFNGSETRRWLTAFGLPALMIIVMIIVQRLFLSGVDPQFWAANAALSQPGKEIHPHSMKGAVSVAAAVAGMLVSLILVLRTGQVSVDGPWSKRLLRFALGIAVLFGIQIGLGKLFPAGESFIALAFRFLRYFIMLIWGIWLAPIVFVKLKLAEPA